MRLAGVMVVPDRDGPGEDALQHFTGEEIKQLASADRLAHVGTGTGKTAAPPDRSPAVSRDPDQGR